MMQVNPIIIGNIPKPKERTMLLLGEERVLVMEEVSSSTTEEVPLSTKGGDVGLGDEEGTDEDVEEGTDEDINEGTDEDMNEGTDEDINEGTDEDINEGTDEDINEGTGEDNNVGTDDMTNEEGANTILSA
mmetsp:Transcript_26016/g.34565  ORF Transcript_26016/g.34565 Transcript_26016/m.34565 type:complete len:131 (-) Transcript_26016:343-735(-)